MTTAPGRPMRPAATGVRCEIVRDATDLALHHAVRRGVFVIEQRIFVASDVDAHDAALRTVHVLGTLDGTAGGAVRLYPLDDSGGGGEWQGDRLAVLPRFRTIGLGAPLVRFAVATAASLGGRRMIAHVQPANEAFFRHLGWTRRGGPEDYVGMPHLLMDIDLRTATRRGRPGRG